MQAIFSSVGAFAASVNSAGPIMVFPTVAALSSGPPPVTVTGSNVVGIAVGAPVASSGASVLPGRARTP